MKNLKFYLEKAKKEKWAIGQFNFSTLEQLKAIIRTAKKLKSPVILGTSESEANFFGMEGCVLLRNLNRKSFPYLFLNLDHGKDISLIKKAIDLGYDSVNFDGSGLPLKENIKKAKQIVKYAHKKKALVEGEVKSIEGGSEIHKELLIFDKNALEDAEAAKEFIKQTGVDIFAINIGNVHGTYAKLIRLDIGHLKKISKKISALMTLHGGSGTDQNDIAQAIKNGVVKININTELRKAWKESLEESLKEETVKPYKILEPVIEKIEQIVKEKIELFGSKNKI